MARCTILLSSSPLTWSGTNKCTVYTSWKQKLVKQRQYKYHWRQHDRGVASLLKINEGGQGGGVQWRGCDASVVTWSQRTVQNMLVKNKNVHGIRVDSARWWWNDDRTVYMYYVWRLGMSYFTRLASVKLKEQANLPSRSKVLKNMLLSSWHWWRRPWICVSESESAFKLQLNRVHYSLESCMTRTVEM
jgi:hypothetical protein